MRQPSVSVEWVDHTQTAIMIVFPERWDLHDFKEAFETVHALMASAPHTVHLITVLPARFLLPPQLFYKIPDIFQGIPENSGLHVVVGGGTLTRTLLGVAKRTFPHLIVNIRIAASRDDALQIVADATNPSV